MKKMIMFAQLVLFLLLAVSCPVHAETTLQDVVYTSYSGKGSAETGTVDAPYSRFEDAVANVADGGTIYVLGGSDSEYGYINEVVDNMPFIIDKKVTVEPANGAEVASLTCRAAGILLEADVTFKNIELDFVNAYHDHIYANGYHLTLDNVTRYQGAKMIDLVAGGLYDATTGTAVSAKGGSAAVITIIGTISNFGNVYAGGMNGGYTGDVIIELESVGTTSVSEIYACGATEPYVNTDNFFDFTEPDYPTANPTQYPVVGEVKVSMEEAGILYVYGAGATDGTEVSYATTYLRSGQTLDSISKLTVVNGTVQPKVLTAPEGQNINVEIQEKGVFDVSNYESFEIDHFVGGGKLIVGTDSLLTIYESASGNTVFETANSVMRQGTYVKMPASATGSLDYTPTYDQKGWSLECLLDETWKSFSATKEDTIFISYWADGEMGNVSADYEILLLDEKAEGVTALPNEGYHFVKWIDYDTEEVVSTEATFVPTWGADHGFEYYYDACFAPNTYSVRFDANGGTGTMAEQSFTYGVQQELSPCGFTKEGYEFIGWNAKIDGTGIAYSDQQLVQNLTAEQEGIMILYAQWKNPDAGSGTEGGGESEGGSGTEDDSSDVNDFQSNTTFDITKVKVAVSKVTYNTVTLSWEARDGATGYEVYRSAKKASGYKKVAMVTGTTYKDTKLKTGKKYYYKVRAISNDKQSNFSEVLTGKPVLAKPVVKITKGKKCATITYGKVKGAEGYEIYRSTKKKKGYKKVDTTKKVRYKNKKLKSKKTYYYKVRAYRKVDGKKVYSSFSKVKSVKVK